MDKNENRKLTAAELEGITGGMEPAPAPVPSVLPASAAEIFKRAQQEIGKPYQWGAVGPEAYDASGLVSYCITGVHARVGTEGTFMGWPRVSDPQPGDICVSSSHCGIYAGVGRMIHAPTFGAVVCHSGIPGGMIIVRYPG